MEKPTLKQLLFYTNNIKAHSLKVYYGLEIKENSKFTHKPL